ncbi:MAG: putative RecB family exonuclease [Microbacteriaceae bacterium]|nr:putative RecB family exonuclease [Microbacteriaceae bacterium]
MKLPGNAIGITDLLSYQDCPRRFAFGMRRHDKSPVVHPDTGVEFIMGDAPEAESPATAYGSAVHDAIELVDDLLTPQEAVERVFPKYGPWLEPADLDRLIEDLAIYKGRDYTGVRIVAQEDDMRVPLFVHDGEQIYFRFKLDKLYQRLDDDASFIHIDYKTSKWSKSQAEVHNDLQMWAYNFGIHELFPECERLLQTYDQLRFGQVNTRKTEKQRAQMKQWLIAATKAVLEDRRLLPKFNQWCPWCEIANDCPIISRLSDYSLSKIAIMAPEEQQGRKKVITLDPDLFTTYAEELPRISLARKTLEKVEKAIRDAIKDLPEDKRNALGFTANERGGGTKFGPEELRAVYELLGDEFWHIIGLTKAQLESYFEDDKDTINAVLELGTETVGAAVLKELAA